MVFLIVSRNIKIHRAVALIRESGIQNPLDKLDLLDYMTRSTGLYARRQGVEPAHGIMVRDGVGLDHLHGLQLFQTCLLCDLVIALVSIMLQMSHIGYIPDIAHLIAEIPEKAHQYVIRHCRPGMSQMRLAIYRRPANIETDHARMHRSEYFLPS